MIGEWMGWMGRMDGVGLMRRIRWGKVEKEIDRKVTLVALRPFFCWGAVSWILGFDFF